MTGPLRRLAIRLATGLVTVALSAGCESAGTGAGAGAGVAPAVVVAPGASRVVNAVLSDPRTFNPLLVTDATSAAILAPLFDGLVETDPLTTKIQPALAESWSFSDDGRDCTFRLRQGLRWSDGAPLTAADVVFTYDAIFAPGVGGSTRFTLTVDGEPIRASALDDVTVRFHMARPFAPFLSAASTPILPRHVLGDALADGSLGRTWGVDTPPGQLVGTGRFRMRRFVPGQLVEYERNPAYWRVDVPAAARLESQVTLIVADQNALSVKFLSGQLDWYAPRPEEVADLEDEAGPLGIRVLSSGLDTGHLFLAFNRNPDHWRLPSAGPTPDNSDAPHDPRLDWFTDRSFLRALAHAVDRRGIVDTIFHGHGEPAASYVSPENRTFHDPDLAPWPYDLGEAARLLDEAGYRDRDGDGRREDPAGHPLEIGLTTNAGNRLRERIGAIVRQDWERLGLTVRFRPISFGALVERLNVTHDWDVVLMGFTGSLEPNEAANFLRSSGNLHLWNPRQKTPATPWEAEIDRLLDQGATELDVEKRRPIYFRIQRILHDELPFIETVRARSFVAVRDRVRNFEPTAWGLRAPERIFVVAP